MNLLESRVMFLDLQTTGAKPPNAQVLEMAWCIGSSRSEQPECATACLVEQPQDQPIPPRITAITGIRQSDLTDAVSKAEAGENLLESVQDCEVSLPVIIHFAQFERTFLSDLLSDNFRHLKIYCTHEIAKRLFPNLPSRGIRALAGYFGVPIDECKRAGTHAHATFLIWRNLVTKLAENGIDTFAQLDDWLLSTHTQRRTKYEYPLEKNVRLNIPSAPGIYRMMSRNGEILYVGKATSLKSRVNSYFRGQRGRDSRKLEMLTQTWNIDYTVCNTVVEACVREAIEIKRLSPPYNISLKTGDRALVFYSQDFSSCAPAQSQQFPLGPFRSELIMDPFVRLLGSLRCGEWDPLMFFDELPEPLLSAGFAVFSSRHVPAGVELLTERTWLAIGLKLCRLYRNEPEEDAAADEQALIDDDLQSTAEQIEKLDAVEELTDEDVADKYERLLMRAASAYRLSKVLTRLLSARIAFVENGGEHEAHTWHGEVKFASDLAQLFAFQNQEPPLWPWQGKDIQTFDCLRVLHTELSRIKASGQKVVVEPRLFLKTETPPKLSIEGASALS